MSRDDEREYPPAIPDNEDLRLHVHGHTIAIRALERSVDKMATGHQVAALQNVVDLKIEAMKNEVKTVKDALGSVEGTLRTLALSVITAIILAIVGFVLTNGGKLPTP